MCFSWRLRLSNRKQVLFKENVKSITIVEVDKKRERQKYIRPFFSCENFLGRCGYQGAYSFLTDWHWASHEIPTGLSWTPEPVPGNSQNVLILASGPADKLETASLFFTTVLNLARKRIWIATPYFIPDEATMVALRLALLKGLEVRILTPELNDNWFVRQAANVYLSELKELGAEIYFYNKGFMHQKVMLVDDRLAIVGTVNFDNRSFRLNFEVTVAVAEKELAGELERMLLDDLSHSTELIDYNLDQQSKWARFKARGADLMAPVL